MKQKALDKKQIDTLISIAQETVHRDEVSGFIPSLAFINSLKSYQVGLDDGNILMCRMCLDLLGIKWKKS